MFRPFMQSLIVAAVALAATGLAGAEIYTNSEFLPDYCRHTKDGDVKDRPTIREYERIFGDGFAHMHHYCRGVFALHEAAQITDNNMLRNGKYKKATTEFNYVLARTDESFVLRPEILVKKGMALLALERDIEAIACFREATALRPDYVPAYVALSNYLRRIGEEAEARRVLEAALSQAPDNEFLRRRLSELGYTPSEGELD